MATISVDDRVFTLINIFPVEPADQKRLFDILTEATETISKMPGYISANIHLSFDGTQVINYAQWRSEADFQAMHSDPRVREHFEECRRISKPQPVFCKLAYTHDAATNVERRA
jgi:heme-degrading monooxygenase HmoA